MLAVKALKHLLITVLSAQLICLPLPQGFLIQTAHAETCSTGLQWNEVLGRCLSTEQASQVQQASKYCESKSTAAEKKQCYVDVVDGKLKDAEASGEVSTAGKVDSNKISIILAMGGLVAAGYFLATGGPSKCGKGAMSAWLIAGASGAVLTGEIMSGMQYKKKMKAAEEKLKKINDSSESTSSAGTTSTTSATNYQAEAFQAMIEKEEAVISAGKLKKNLYMVATAGYAAAAVMAGIETFKGGAGGFALTNCNISASVNPNDHLPAMRFVTNYFEKQQRVDFQSYTNLSQISMANNEADFLLHEQQFSELLSGAQVSSSLTQHEAIKTSVREQNFELPEDDFKLIKSFYVTARSFLIPMAHAQTEVLVNTPIAAPTPAVDLLPLINQPAVVSQGNILHRLFATPWTRLAFTSILTVNSFFMMSHISKEIKKAEGRKKFLEKLKEEVSIAGAGLNCANNDRSDPAKPNCYCFTGDGAVNPARSNSQICRGLFTSNTNLAASSYGTSGTNSAASTACVTSTGAYDGSCSCASTNTCLTVGSNISGSVPSGISLGTIPSTINSINSGKLSGATVDPAAMARAAANMNRMRDQLAQKNPTLKAANAKAEKDAKALMNNMSRQLASSPSLAAAAPGLGLSDDSTFATASTPEEALDKIRQDINRVESNLRGGSASNQAADNGLDLSGLSGGAGGGVTIDEGQLAQMVENGLNNSNSDINTNSDTNLFDIIRHRYQRSGMPRLFGGEAIMPAEKAADTQINR